MPTTECWTDLWNDFKIRAQRLSDGRPPRDAVDRTILWQFHGTEPYCQEPTELQRLQLPELYSGSPWRQGAPRPEILGDRWVAFVALNPSLTEAESFPRLGQVDQHGVASLQRFFDERFEPSYRAFPARRGRQGGRIRLYGDLDGQPHSNQTWSVLDNMTREALAGYDVQAPLGDVGAVVDAVPYKFRKWGAAPAEMRDELVAHSRARFLAFLNIVRPTMVIFLGTATHALLDVLPAVDGAMGAPIAGVFHAGRRRLGRDGPAAEVLATVHPASPAWNTYGSRAHVRDCLRHHLLGEAAQ